MQSAIKHANKLLIQVVQILNLHVVYGLQSLDCHLENEVKYGATRNKFRTLASLCMNVYKNSACSALRYL